MAPRPCDPEPTSWTPSNHFLDTLQPLRDLLKVLTNTDHNLQKSFNKVEQKSVSFTLGTNAVVFILFLGGVHLYYH